MMMEQLFRNYLADTSSKGSQFIEHGEFDEAVELYRSGLNLIKAAMLQLNAGREDSPIAPASSSSSDDLVCAAESIPQIRFARLSKSPLSRQHEQHMLIYQTPLELPEDEPYSYDQACFVFIYNLALSYHLLCCATAAACEQEQREKVRTLSKTALELWEIVYRLHLREDMGVKGIHTCAILNNLGQLCQTYGNMVRSRQCFTGLLSVMHSLEGSGDPDFLSGYETLMNSVMSLLGHGATIAPAA
jgi:hypothetical protein